ncbi:uncharacterized protein [Henckelia pumila]|uniref:uncharacterized protein n=1 Tax=Henckelia pumila TaxID=405737 RepID=UPI003C6DED06
MVNSERKQSGSNRQCEDDDRADRNFDGDDSIDEPSSGAETSANANPSIVQRLTEIFVEDGDGDLLLQTSDREDGFLQWFRALDFQVTGACRADERLKPLLKLNVSTGAAEDRLLAHLSQHFEPSEVAILARCLCIPLVSIRVGKIEKKGTLLSPTSKRGNLCLSLLPTSDMRISFNGDDGSVERLATFSTEAQCTAIDIEEISADKSGRSFLIKISDAVVCYFWCSEKSKLLGNELLKNMKDLLMRKPSLAELSGISEQRLNFFATHLHAYLAGSVVTSAQVSGVLSVSSSSDSTIDPCEQRFPQSSSTCQKFSYVRQYGGQGSKTNLIYQGSLSPKSNQFKEGMSKSLSSMRSASREKLKWCVENYVSSVENLALASSSNFDPSNANCFEQDELSEPNASRTSATFSLLEMLGKSSELPFSGSGIQIPSSGSSHLSPQYCWCPPVASALQFTKGNSHLPILSTESLSLPPISSLLSASRQSRLLTSNQTLNMAEIPLDFPTFAPEPLVRLPTSQQIPTFTPLICDPIVHIPVIDVCSSGQGYLVSAGPAISTAISPLNPNLVDPLPAAESMLEKGARETLRMLISGSSQPNSQLLDVLPSMLSSGDDKQNVIAAGSRGLYSGTIDVDVFTQSFSTMGLVLLSEKPIRSGISKRFGSRDDLIDQKEKPSSSGMPHFDQGID